MIEGVNQVILAVDDEVRALSFWTETIGFELVRDQYLGAERWIELRPPASTPLLVLSARAPDEPARPVPNHLPHSNVFFTCSDIRSTHEELAAKGVRFPTPPTEMPWGWWAMFEDPEGTRFALGQE